MQIVLNIVGSSFEEIRAGLTDFLASSTQVAAPAAAESPPLEPRETPDMGAPTPKRRGRPPRPQTDQPVTDINANGDPTAAVNAVRDPVAAYEAANKPAPTVDEVRNAIKALMAATDENTTYELIKTFGAKSASTLHEAGKGAEFVAAATAAVEAKKAAT